MDEILLEVSLILALILLNGFFAAAEMAVVSARRSRLQALAADGDPDARRVLALQQDPGRFLSTVQIGITLVGTLASAVGGASVVRFLEPRLAALPLPWPPIYEEVVYEGYRLVVQEMEARRISQVVIAPLSRGEESEHADRTQETV